MWKSVNDIEEAKRIISNPTYKETGKFAPDCSLLDKYDFEGKVILDFGCGIGRNAKYILTKQPLDLICYDYPNMIKMAKEYIGRDDVTYIEHPIINLRGFRVDYIYANIVLQHIPIMELKLEVLPTLQALLKPEGRLLVSSRGFTDDDNNIWEILRKFFTPLTGVDEGDKSKKHQQVEYICV